MKCVTLKVVDSSGRPQRDARVGIEVHQFMAGGFVDNQYTDSDGEADFELDIDDSAEITIYVNGQPKVSRGPVYAEYVVTI